MPHIEIIDDLQEYLDRKSGWKIVRDRSGKIESVYCPTHKKLHKYSDEICLALMSKKNRRTK